MPTPFPKRRDPVVFYVGQSHSLDNTRRAEQDIAAAAKPLPVAMDVKRQDFSDRFPDTRRIGFK